MITLNKDDLFVMYLCWGKDGLQVEEIRVNGKVLNVNVKVEGNTITFGESK